LHFKKTRDGASRPSMRQRIDVAKLYDEAVQEMRADSADGAAPGAWPDANPFSLDDLLAGDHTMLLARLTGEAP
jgi:hypothetical protein